MQFTGFSFFSFLLTSINFIFVISNCWIYWNSIVQKYQLHSLIVHKSFKCTRNERKNLQANQRNRWECPLVAVFSIWIVSLIKFTLVRQLEIVDGYSKFRLLTKLSNHLCKPSLKIFKNELMDDPSPARMKEQKQITTYK